MKLLTDSNALILLTTHADQHSQISRSLDLSLHTETWFHRRYVTFYSGEHPHNISIDRFF